MISFEWLTNLLTETDPDIDTLTISDYIVSLCEDDIDDDELKSTLDEILTVNTHIKTELIDKIMHKFRSSKQIHQPTIATESGSIDVVNQLRSFIESDKGRIITKEAVSKDLDHCTKSVLKNAGVKQFQDDEERQRFEILQANIDYAEKQQSHSHGANTASVLHVSETGEIETLVENIRDDLDIKEVANSSGYIEKTKEAATVMDALKEFDPTQYGSDKAKLDSDKKAKMIATPGEEHAKKLASQAVAFIQQRAALGSTGRMDFSVLNSAVDTSKNVTESKQSKKTQPPISKKLKNIGRKGEEAFVANEKQREDNFKNKGLSESRIMELHDFL